MDDNQITALAHEYAEEKCGKELSNTLAFSREKDEMEANLRWLLSRFYLVEKSKVKQLKQCFGSEEVYEVIDMLFPGIAKEVES